MRKFTKWALFILLELQVLPVFSQLNIHGTVVNKKTKEPLALAFIKDLNTAQNALADEEGRFSLNVAGSGDSIEISFIGYLPVKIEARTLYRQSIIGLEKGAVDLKEIVITAQTNNLTTERTLSRIDLNRQPVKSAQDLLRLVPGLFIAQHQGGGKAEQIFLRGFDADHGTDVNISVDGMPVNMVSHAHGQGYADLHFLIPETVSSFDFGKGPYYSSRGDLCTAGFVAYETKNALDQNMVKLEGGQYTTGRAVLLLNLLGEKAKQKAQNAYLAGEALYSNGGPFTLPEHFTRYNLFGKFSAALGNNSKISLSLSTLSSGWRASGEIPNRAVKEGYIENRFGVLDSAQGGYTSRTNANLLVTTNLPGKFRWTNQAFYSHYYFGLISNFTFYYYFPVTGDEFRQHEIRNLVGYNSRLSKRINFRNMYFNSEAGAGFRYDAISPSELDHTMNGNFLSYMQLGKTNELNGNAWLDETMTAGKWLINLGLRLDYFHFYYLNLAPASDTFAAPVFKGQNPNSNKSIISPKLNIQYTVNQSIQLYFKSGKGFHSNDARVVIANQGYDILPAAYGADLGINWKPLPRLYINTAFWYLYLKQEFTFGQDLVDQPGGPVQPSGRTSRAGVDFSARYQLNDWLFASFNADFAHPRFIDSAAGHRYLPLAPTFTSTAALGFKTRSGWNGGISYRYLHDRAANSTYTLTALGYFVSDLSVNYTKSKYEIGLSVSNLFNAKWNESQFEYISKLKNETSPVDEVSYTPGVPFFAKLKFSVFF